ncbi:Formate-dependent phosphoribosylglycinamide formyltransferase [Bienertia sinuspersici]
MDMSPCIVLHHGGRWDSNPHLSYLGGQVKIVNDLLTDFNGSYMKSLINSLGYDSIIKLHYCDPLKNLQSGVKFLGYEDCTFVKFSSLLSDENVRDEGNQTINPIVLHYDPTTVYGYDYEPELDDVLQISKGDDIDHVEEGSDIDDAEVTDAREKLSLDNNLEIEFINELESLDRVAGRLGEHNDVVLTDEDGDSSEFESPNNSNDENECGFLLPHTVSHKKQQMRKQSWAIQPLSETESPFFLGQEFEDVVELREAITTYSASIGRDIKYFKYDKTRIGAKCKAKDKGCLWYLWASTKGGNGSLTVKTHVPNCSCGRLAKSKRIRATLIANQYHGKFKINPYLKCQEIVNTIWS